MTKKCLPSTHPVISECLGPLAIIYMNDGEVDETLICIQKSMKIRQDSLLPSHVSAVYSQGRYAVLQYLRDDRSLSESSNECLPTTLLKWQVDSKQNPMTLSLQGRIYWIQNKIDEALSTVNQYFSIQKENLSLQHSDLATAYMTKGICHLRKNDLTEALENLRQGIVDF